MRQLCKVKALATSRSCIKGSRFTVTYPRASGKFKNLGAGPILGAPDTDILSPIYIQLEGDAPILEASVQKMTRSVIEVSLDQSKASSGRLGLGWKILEQNDGFVVQITYVGPTNTNIQVTGTVKGQQQGLRNRDTWVFGQQQKSTTPPNPYM